MQDDGGRVHAARSDAPPEALRRKAELEFALQASPDDPSLRVAYFEQLLKLASEHTGLGHALLPELGHPVYFRGATPDAANLAQVFRDRILDMPMVATPRRILVLGAYAGYAALWLADRHPLAEIACVEPMPANLRLLMLNTVANPRIRVLGTAVWHSTTRLAIAARLAGDWAPGLNDRGDEAERTVPARPVADLLNTLGWSQVDFVLCDVVGAEAAVFADPEAPWVRHLDVALVQTYPGLMPEVDKLVGACFPAAFYDHKRHGEYEKFTRRIPLRAHAPSPQPLMLIADEPGFAALALHDLEPVPWSFFVFDGTSLQLHPNPPGRPAAGVLFPRVLSGQTRFTATLHHAGGGAPVAFALVLERPDGSQVLRAERVVAAGEQSTWLVALPAPIGPHRVVLQTAMAAGAANNHGAWSRFIAPSLS